MIKQTISILLQIAVVGFAVLHFFTSVFVVPSLVHALSVGGLLVFLFSTLRQSIVHHKLPLTLFVMALFIMKYANVPILLGVLTGIIQMRDMIGLLIVIPLISWVLREEPYIEDIMAYFHRFIMTSRRFYFALTGFTQIISYFLLFGSIPMMYQFVQVILKEQKAEVWENFKATAILRGFSLSTLWVISIPSFIYAVETLNASLWKTVLQGLFIAVLGTFLAVYLGARQEKRYGVSLTPALQDAIYSVLQKASKPAIQRKKVFEFISLFITLFGSILLIHTIFHVRLMLVIPIVVLVWTLAFYTYKRRLNRLGHVLKIYLKKDITKQSYQLSIMLAVGVLIYSLNQTNFAEQFVNGLYYFQSFLPFLNVLYLLPFIIIILGLFSLGPLTVMVLVAGILEHMSIPYPPELIVLAITSGSAISIVISPLIMPVIVLSASNRLSLWKNGFKFNYKFAIALYILVQLYIQTIVYVWL